MTVERKFDTLAELIYWSYANLQMADAACSMHKDKYDRVCYSIRAKAYKAYKEGTWHISDLYRQQIEKLQKSDHVCAPPPNHPRQKYLLTVKGLALYIEYRDTKGIVKG